MNATPKLLDSYATPAFSYGDVVTCARRGEVRIVGLYRPDQDRKARTTVG